MTIGTIAISWQEKLLSLGREIPQNRVWESGILGDALYPFISLR